ncbi:IS1249 family transposase [Corynebacterium ulceribovis]|uniref:IS1249 family transposase n=1 Tax=Corynebacterium ulceribovis TaxID=487732 RepID=UPI00036D6379|nr:IS1249 family transposase [Corynebacterium ulceribovis]
MTTNRPRCPLCDSTTKKNGTTSKQTTRWRCTTCGHSFTRTTQTTHTNTATMTCFISWITGTQPLAAIAANHGVTKQTMHHRFHWCWWILPTPAIDSWRVYDQIFLDATYLGSGCLLIAASRTHVINWSWARSETTAAYTELLRPIPAPLIAVIDGGQGAQSTIYRCWPTTKIQRCLVHAQRTVRRNTTSKPRTTAGKTLYRLALQLTRITDLNQAANWVRHLHDFDHTYRAWMNEQTTTKDPATGAYTTVYTHYRVRAAYQSLLSLHRRDLLFTYLQPPPGTTEPDKLAATTNCLEGGINAPLKELARRHRGLSIPHQRTVMDWWLYLHTEVPDDPVRIARDQRWGQTALSTATDLITHDTTAATNDTGAPAEYDTAIDTSYQHSLGIQQGWVR